MLIFQSSFCHHHLQHLLQHNPEIFDILVLAYPGCPGILTVNSRCAIQYLLCVWFFVASSSNSNRLGIQCILAGCSHTWSGISVHYKLIAVFSFSMYVHQFGALFGDSILAYAIFLLFIYKEFVIWICMTS